MSSFDDPDFILGLKNGQRAAFQKLIQRLFPRIRGYLMRKLSSMSNKHDDILQDIAIKILVNIQSFNPNEGKFIPWCFIIVKNHIIDVLRKKNCSPQHVSLDEENDEITCKQMEFEKSREIEIIGKLSDSKLKKALMSVSKNDRNILIRYAEEDPETIANSMNISMTALYARKSRAAEKVRDIYYQLRKPREVQYEKQ